MKHIMQHDTMQCGVACIEMICKYYDVLETGRKAGGVACIEMICKYYRKKYYFNSLSYLYTTTEGISLFALSLLAKEIGLRTICGRINMKKIKEAKSPCILHWNQNHFVVLYKVKRGKIFYIADPAKGLVKYSLEEFKKHWVSTQSDGEEKGIAMFLEPIPAFYEKKMGEEPKEERSFNMQVLCKQNIYENCRDKES